MADGIIYTCDFLRYVLDRFLTIWRLNIKSIFFQCRWECRTQWSHHGRAVVIEILNWTQVQWGTNGVVTHGFLHVSYLSTAFWELTRFRPTQSSRLCFHLFFVYPALCPSHPIPISSSLRFPLTRCKMCIPQSRMTTSDCISWPWDNLLSAFGIVTFRLRLFSRSFVDACWL